MTAWSYYCGEPHPEPIYVGENCVLVKGHRGDHRLGTGRKWPNDREDQDDNTN